MYLFFFRASKTVSPTAAPVPPEPRSMPVAVFILGLPPPLKDKPKLPKAILPVDVQKTIEGMKAEQTGAAESPSIEAETPVRQNAVIQTEIYGVENLAVEGRENLSNAKTVGPKQDKNMTKPVHRTAKSKLRPDKENLLMSRNKKSSTGMQTSVSLFPRKRLKTVTGTQTSGDYILKKAMASADIPIQRKTVGSQVTPQKSGGKLPRKRATCSSETQTGISPEKKSKDGTDIDLTTGTVENITQSAKEMEVAEILSDSFSTSTQTLQSYIESLRDKQLEVNTVGGNILSLTPNGNLIISPSRPHEIQNMSVTLNRHVGEPRNSSNMREQDANTPSRKSDEIVHSLSDITPIFIESLGLKPAKAQSMISKEISTSTSDVHDTARKQNDVDTAFQMVHHRNISSSTELNNAVNSELKHSFENAMGAVASPKDKAVKPKRNTIRNLLTESVKNNVTISESTRIYRPFLSTTSGITFNSSSVTYSNAQTAQTITESPIKVALSSSVAANEHFTQPDYDSHKLFNPVQDQMFGGRANENSNTIDMEAQAMSSSEFEQLLLASGLLLEAGAQTEHVISDYGIQTPAPNLDKADTLIGNKVPGFVQREMGTETLNGPEFDFLDESSSTIDMNTQTITDFGSLLGPMDSDTQTVSDIDFLDLVMTNMETQTLSDQDLIDLGLMDAAQTGVEPFNVEMDYLRSSETQTSLVSLVESGTTFDSSKSVNVGGNMIELDKNINKLLSANVTDKVINATTALTIQCDDRNAKTNYGSDNTNVVEVNIAEPQEATDSKQNDQSEDFQTTNMETQTAFDELEKLVSQ